MTNELSNEQAIRELKAMREHIEPYMSIVGLTAYEMAIKALEQEPCEDCISREETLNNINKLIAEYIPLMPTGWTLPLNIAKTINELPSVTPKARWIPVSERLPEDNIHVLCQFTLSGMGECYLAHGVFHVVGGVVMTCNEVIAWMPLPQPYKAESEGSE